MVADYSKLTREELVAALVATGAENKRQTKTLEMGLRQNEVLQTEVVTLRTWLHERDDALKRAKRLRAISLKASAALASAWLDMIDYLRD